MPRKSPFAAAGILPIVLTLMRRNGDFIMNTYQEPARTLPVVAEVDVLVVGGGPSGFSAAVCAARKGAKTMLIEQSGDVGGVATTGLMSHWTGNTAGGFYEELLNRSCDCDPSDSGLRRTINPEKLKTVMMQMLAEAGVILQLYTFASDAVMDGDRICGVITESKSGREVIMAKVVIDASGDGDIAAKTGARYYKGRENDGKMQPMTLMAKVDCVDVDRVHFIGSFESSYMTDWGDLQTMAREKLPYPAGHVLIYRSTLPGVVTLNMTNCIDVDGTDARDLTKAAVTCRGQLDAIIDFLQKYVAGFENCRLISTASIIGVRETRHFAGVSTITEDDIKTARVFDDWAVTKAHFNFDIHNISGAGLDKNGCQKHFKQQSGYTIPYGCFVPEKIDGLLLAGRCISGTHIAHSNYRVMPICANMGQSTGIAAAMCAASGIQPRQLDVKALQAELRAVGVEP